MNAKNTGKKSPIHENANANITCDFGDGDISRCRSRLPHGQKLRLRLDGHMSPWIDYHIFQSKNDNTDAKIICKNLDPIE